MLKQALVGVAFAALSAPAFAGGLAPVVEEAVVVPVVTPAPSTDWSGFYVGLRAGTADFETEVPLSLSRSLSYPTDGSFYGGMIGYRHDFGRFVVGGELRYSDISDISGSSLPPGFTNDSMTTAVLQLGYDMGRVLPFVSVGGARLATSFGGSSETGNGTVYGAGVDFMATSRLMFGVDFNRFEFEDYGSFGADITGTSIAIRAAFKF